MKRRDINFERMVYYENEKKLFLLTGILTLFLLICCGQTCVKGNMANRLPPVPKRFSICTATLDGKNFTEIVSDPKRELYLPRVSNDHKWITFTRFNKLNRGVAMASHLGGYEETEIMLCRIDGSELQALVPSKKGIINGNGYWTPDNKGILYASTDTPNKMPQLFIVNIETKQKKPVPLSTEYFPCDPHMVDDLVVFPAKTKKLRKNVIYIMKKDGSGLRRLTNANAISKAENDPKISPDKSKVAFCRNTKGIEHHTIIVDIKTGKEKDISPQNVMEGIPEWSSDGKLLVCWQLNMAERIRQVKSLPPTTSLPPLITHLFTVRPDGSQRTKVPLPKGLAYTVPAFFPGTGSGKNAKIVFSIRSFAAKP